jgi:hypothetical protein
MDLNIGCRFLEMDLHKFDGPNLVGWVSHMGHYFSLHNTMGDLNKLLVGVLYLDQERWQWWLSHNKCYGGYIAWSQFANIICAHFNHESHFLECLTKLRKTGLIKVFIATFE